MAYEISLKDKVSLVTGGAGGIGAEICRQLAMAGSDIVINDVAINRMQSEKARNAVQRLEQELRECGVNVLKHGADITKEAEVKAMVEQVVSELGHIDVLVNNAARIIPAKFDEMGYETWKAVLDVDLNGTFLVTRYVVPVMLMRGCGSIIMISSNATINGGGGGAHYPAAKAGMEGLARQLVVEYASRGIRTNIIQPAVIDTDLLRNRYPTDEEVAAYGKKIPVGRVGKPSDVANAAVFLASDKASYICGASLLVDGGRTYFWR